MLTARPSNKEDNKFEYLNGLLQLAIRKKDEIITLTLEENRKLREENASLKNLIRTKEIKIEDLKGIKKAQSKKGPIFTQPANNEDAEKSPFSSKQ